MKCKVKSNADLVKEHVLKYYGSMLKGSKNKELLKKIPQFSTRRLKKTSKNKKENKSEKTFLEIQRLENKQNYTDLLLNTNLELEDINCEDFLKNINIRLENKFESKFYNFVEKQSKPITKDLNENNNILINLKKSINQINNLTETNYENLFYKELNSFKFCDLDIPLETTQEKQQKPQKKKDKKFKKKNPEQKNPFQTAEQSEPKYKNSFEKKEISEPLRSSLPFDESLLKKSIVDIENVDENLKEEEQQLVESINNHIFESNDLGNSKNKLFKYIEKSDGEENFKKSIKSFDKFIISKEDDFKKFKVEHDKKVDDLKKKKEVLEIKKKTKFNLNDILENKNMDKGCSKGVRFDEWEKDFKELENEKNLMSEINKIYNDSKLLDKEDENKKSTGSLLKSTYLNRKKDLSAIMEMEEDANDSYDYNQFDSYEKDTTFDIHNFKKSKNLLKKLSKKSTESYKKSNKEILMESEKIYSEEESATESDKKSNKEILIEVERKYSEEQSLNNSEQEEDDSEAIISENSENKKLQKTIKKRKKEIIKEKPKENKKFQHILEKKKPTYRNFLNKKKKKILKKKKISSVEFNDNLNIIIERTLNQKARLIQKVWKVYREEIKHEIMYVKQIFDIFLKIKSNEAMRKEYDLSKNNVNTPECIRSDFIKFVKSKTSVSEKTLNRLEIVVNYYDNDNFFVFFH